jgi:GT2 family glycosyltransferase
MNIICVCYNNPDEVVAYVNHLSEQFFFGEPKIHVVDNSCNVEVDRCLRASLACFSNVSIYSANKNLGYFGAAHWVYERFIKNISFDFLVVSNTDIEILDKNFFKKLSSKYSPSKKVFVIAPSILDCSTKNDQNPFFEKRPSSWRMKFYVFLYRSLLVYRVYSFFGFLKDYVKRLFCHIRHQAFDNRARAIYSPHGAFVVFHQNYFKSGCDLSYPVFLYNEEIFIAEQVEKNGGEIIYDPEICVVHKEHAVTSLLGNQKKMKYQCEAARYCYEHYFNE